MPLLLDITLTDILAVWGAFIATLVLLWDIYKWIISGAKVVFRVTPNRLILGDNNDFSEDKKYIHMEAINNGERPTTLTKTAACYYKNWLNRIQRKPEAQFYIKAGGDKLPYLLEPGKIWNGFADQAKLEQLPMTGMLIFAIYLPHKNKPQKVRVCLTPKQ